MSISSNIDDDLKGEVDFDFFGDDDPNKSQTVTSDPRQSQQLKTPPADTKHSSRSSSSRSSSAEDRSSKSWSSRSRSPSPTPHSKTEPSRSSRSRSRSPSPSARSRSRSQSPSARSTSRSPKRTRSLSPSPRERTTTPPLLTSHHSSSSDLSTSESTVTDVSPLSSRDSSPGRKNRSPRGQSSRPTPDPGPTQIPGLHKNRMTKPAPNDEDHMNVELIMKALLELDKDRQQYRSSRPEKDRARDIDFENQKLLQNLLQIKGRPKGAIPSDPPVKRPSHSTINRQRQQRKIEEENKAIVKRLMRIRPTPGMTRNEQLSEYKRQSTYGVPMYKADGGKQRRLNVAPSPYLGMGSMQLRRTASATSLNSANDSEMFNSTNVQFSGKTESARVTHSRTVSANNAAKAKRSVRPASATFGGRTGPGQPRSLRPGLASSRPEWPSGW